MSSLRPECRSGTSPAMAERSALYLIRKAVLRRRSLIRGRLNGRDEQKGKHCALGCLWNDYPTVVLTTALVDEIAAVNDALPAKTSANKRWKAVKDWLNWRIERLEQ